jgi:PAS domain S-box-containing protein
VTIPGRRGQAIRAELEETTMEWQGRSADVTILREIGDERASRASRALEAEVQARETRLRELTSILDTATDGVIVLDEAGRILSLNRSAEALFGYDQAEVAGQIFTRLFAPEAAQVAMDYLNGLRSNGVESLLNDGREVLGLVGQGGTIPLSMTLGRLGDGPARTFCAVLRDNTAVKKAERDLIAAKHAAEEASARKSDLLAKISHEIRTPLNAIVGFAEVMLEERFGAIGNERYRDYLKDIRASGVHVVSLVDDLLDLAKAEAGETAMAFAELDLNAIVGACVASLQGSAARERIVMRTSFAPRLPRILADERSTRQIAATIVTNAIRFTQAGGQVIVSTALTDWGEVAFRVRDTGVGMTNEQLEQALEPFRPVPTGRRGGGSGLGLPLTRALVQANRALLHITSAPHEGTLAEVLFPPTRVLADEPRSQGTPEGRPARD